MLNAPIYPQEELRLKALEETRTKIGKNKKLMEELVSEIHLAFKTPMVAISMIEKDKEICEVSTGPIPQEGPRSISFCGHALLCEGVFVVEDTTKDSRFSDNPYVVGEPFVRFYAGVRLYNLNHKEPVAVFCIKDTSPRKLSVEDIGRILDYAEKIQTILNS